MAALGDVRLAVPVSGLTLWSAARRDRRTRSPFALSLAGLMLMAGGIAAEGAAFEPVLTSVGARFVTFAHLANWRFRPCCRMATGD